LFINSQLADDLYFLNETLFEPTDEGENVLDIERVIIRYQPSDNFSLQAGRFHTSLSYWNETFHHGEFLQDRIGRPSILNFEDEDGLPPMHSIGLRAQGIVDADTMAVEYKVEIANGRGPTPDPPQVTVDANDHKAINVSLSFEFDSLSGLQVGTGYYIDKIPSYVDEDDAFVHGELDEDVMSIFPPT
jgi:hypothetical protein